MSLKNQKVGDLIKQYRVQRDLTQEELSHLLNFDTPQFISNIERGIAKTPLNVLGRLIQILNIPEKDVVELMVTDYRSNLVTEISKAKRA
jgi:transcriptional regulator with XRE-family HTH domain